MVVKNVRKGLIAAGITLALILYCFFWLRSSQPKTVIYRLPSHPAQGWYFVVHSWEGAPSVETDDGYLFDWRNDRLIYTSTNLGGAMTFRSYVQIGDGPPTSGRRARIVMGYNGVRYSEALKSQVGYNAVYWGTRESFEADGQYDRLLEELLSGTRRERR